MGMQPEERIKMRRDMISFLSYSRTADKDKEESVKKSGKKLTGRLNYLEKLIY